jgi:DNA mismatch repair protein MutS
VALTPMMQQYLQVKEKCKDCILFFRLGDFYEMFFGDAEVASKELELVLTGRDCGLENRAPMCGIPYHAANSYISRLISKGYKVAICEQMEDPSAAKGIVRRDIIKIVTPGTYTDASFLEDNKNNYIMSLYVDENKDYLGICFVDISTGEFYCTEARYEESVLADEISKFSPKEILLQKHINENILTLIKDRFGILYTEKEEEFFTKNSVSNMQEKFSNTNVEAFDNCILCAGSGLLNYIMETQKQNLCNINSIEYYSIQEYLNIDINSRRNLELTETLRDKSKKGSLLWVLDKTNTAMGARQLRRWVEQPLIQKSKIEARLNAVEELSNNLSYQEDLKSELCSVYDIERIVGKVASKSVNAKELTALKNSLGKIPSIKETLSQFKSDMLKSIWSDMDELQDLHQLLDISIMDSPAFSVKEGGIVKEGYNNTVDELREAKAHGKEWIASLENDEREHTGIRSLKVGYNKVFGYYIEITNANKGLIPDGRYIRKQTLSNAERYITPELKEMEDKILGAEEKLINLEYELFAAIRDKVEMHTERMKHTGKLLAELDCLVSLSLVALENNYCKPEVSDNGMINIQEGRHPVIERMLPSGTFVSNDTKLDNKEQSLLLITGPNMAGKSTYMRQVALITLMAQIGSYIPAKSASISICDRIFTRIGASDDLSAGKSTFMVEMWEVSNILSNATKKSLVLLDEVGRGTSTYDGLSIAWSVIEYICNSPSLKCKTLFATHYHELTKLEGLIHGVVNYSVAVKEIGSDIVFLRKIVKGGADQSYGIEVAKLAGIPDSVIIRAKELLNSLENKESLSTVDASTEVYSTDKINSKLKAPNKKNSREGLSEAAVDTSSKAMQVSFSDLEKDAFINDIKNLDILNLTPMEGFNKLFNLINKAKSI